MTARLHLNCLCLYYNYSHTNYLLHSMMIILKKIKTLSTESVTMCVLRMYVIMYYNVSCDVQTIIVEYYYNNLLINAGLLDVVFNFFNMRSLFYYTKSKTILNNS